MFDVLAKVKACCTQRDILTKNALIHCLIGMDFSQLAPVTIVEELLPDFLIVFALDVLELFLLEFSEIFCWFPIPAQRALNDTLLAEFVLGPLGETLQMEHILTLGLASGNGVLLHNLHLTDRTDGFILVILFILLHDDLPRYSFFDVLEKISDFIRMNYPTCNYIP